ncbi:MAG TPA: hypothetical protein VGI40_24705 [Pirellulaceae bacterium]
MEPDELLGYVRNACERLEVTYMVVGSIASIAYGETRFTNDIDVVIDLPSEKADAFCASFPVEEFYVSRQAVTQAVAKHSQFNVIHPASGLKVDFIVLSESDFDQSRRQRRRQLSVLPVGPMWFASPEDVILKKMVYFQEGGSDKHLRDIAGVLRIQRNRLDRDYVAGWAKLLGVETVWQSLVAKEQEPE